VYEGYHQTANNIPGTQAEPQICPASGTQTIHNHCRGVTSDPSPNLALRRLLPRVNCQTGASYDDVVKFFFSSSVAQLQQWPARDYFPYNAEVSSNEECDQATLHPSQVPQSEQASSIWREQAVHDQRMHSLTSYELNVIALP
jgi:hypothetical protein